jgi:hypothetical protein
LVLFFLGIRRRVSIDRPDGADILSKHHAERRQRLFRTTARYELNLPVG